MFVHQIRVMVSKNQIEGAKSEGKKVVVIEDLISTGDLQSQQLKP